MAAPDHLEVREEVNRIQQLALTMLSEALVSWVLGALYEHAGPICLIKQLNQLLKFQFNVANNSDFFRWTENRWARTEAGAG